MFKWIKNHNILIIITILIMIIGIPIVINNMFKFSSGLNFLVAEWDAGDLLGYYGDVLSFFGTVSLGFLALYQNKLINDKADEINRKNEELTKMLSIPRFYFFSSGFSGEQCDLICKIINVSNNAAYKVNMYNIKILNENNTTVYNSNNNWSDFTPILKGENEKAIILKNDSVKLNYTIQIKFEYYDKYGDKHECLIKGKNRGLTYIDFSITEAL